ncbi:MAG: flagellar hook-associated protein FlgK [Verrucomicrobiota bacterium]|nr:flagellar hook-associated protein FlgK [Verrucomicrobiota bacterium]
MGIGLFGTMEMARNSLAASRTSAEVTGHNLANAANPAYARQRIKVEPSPALPTTEGPQGTGANVAGFEQIRDYTLDKFLVNEKYLTSYYDSKLTTLMQAQARLGQILDRQTVDPKSGNGGQTGLAERITDFFNTFQSLSAAPTSNTERRLTVVSGQELADRFQRAHDRLSTLRADINSEVNNAITEVNRLLESISVVSQRIGATETEGTGMANELRDTRQSWYEELAKYTDFSTSENVEGKMTLTIAGHTLVDEDTLVEQLQATTITDPTTTQAGMTYVKMINKTGLLNVTGGKIRGLIDARDDTIYAIKNEVDTVAANLITEVNDLHATGYDLDGYMSVSAKEASDIFTRIGHGYKTGDKVMFNSGAPAGAVDGTPYYVKKIDDNTFTLHDTESNASVGAGKINVTADTTDLTLKSFRKFFTGTGAADIEVETTLIADPRRIQASAYANEPGDNTIAKQIAGLSQKAISTLTNLTFNERYNNAVAQFGQSVSNVETHLEAQEAVERLLLKQRDTISGVSIDEEVANLMIYQRAFQASSRIISTVDALLADLLRLK